MMPSEAPNVHFLRCGSKLGTTGTNVALQGSLYLRDPAYKLIHAYDFYVKVIRLNEKCPTDPVGFLPVKNLGTKIDLVYDRVCIPTLEPEV